LQKIAVIAAMIHGTFVSLFIVAIVLSLIKIAASNENIECFREYFVVGYIAHLILAFF
jgi:hypothetical protein